MSHIPQQQPETSGGKRGTSKLGNPISRHPSPRKVADQCEGEGHCRVEVCATDVPKGIDHHGDDEAKTSPTPTWVTCPLESASIMMAPQPAKTRPNVPMP